MALTNKQFAEKFVNEYGKDFRNGNGTMFTDGPIAYSYGRHFPMARKTGLTDGGGYPIMLITSDRYSVTTARHISLIKQAADGWNVIEVPNINARTDKEHATNIQHLFTERSNLRVFADRARTDWNKQFYTKRAEDIESDIREYRRAFKAA